ncbi:MULTISPECIES: hypothetical protein [Paenibacillus]|uniref:XRE family transcriptional regulator n=1 Tax=Paenibacillus urinalis TaxID=521520 RepID=A0AAX3N0H5_9BACL|nr:hypothetical protein [Paenibacillus urinalis]WDH83343.1 hypothetical protein PUW23_03605 [Paenibacillus urinalis]
MSMVNYYDHQQTVKECLLAFMRQKGYSRLTFSKLTNIPRRAINQLMLQGGGNIDKSEYNAYIVQINQTFNFAEDYLLTTREGVKSSTISSVKSERSPEAEEAHFGLECILDIYSMYIK